MDYKLNTSDAYAALRIKDFRRFITARFLMTLAIQMQSIIVGWQIYSITHSALSLGLIGVAEVIPFFCVTLFAGHVADKVVRKKIIISSNLIYLICAVLLLLISTFLKSYLKLYGPYPIYTVIFITGIARGFMSPAQVAFSAQLIPRELFGNSSTWNTVAWQIAEVTGPAIGGLIVGFGGFAEGYSTVVIFAFAALLFYSFIENKPLPESTRKETIYHSLTSGLRFVFGHQIILSALSLDMFAVFFGGAVSILPVFADQVFHVGAQGLGILRAAPAAGAIIMSFIQAYKPPFKKAGSNLLIAVTGFGLCIITFSLPGSFYIAIIILMLSGMFDNISVIIRGTITQLFTPDDMRGRVSSVNGIFISSSNELGSFESGLAASVMGLIPSVIFGGSMTLLIVFIVWKFAPRLKGLKL